jgi:hypothetical protein
VRHDPSVEAAGRIEAEELRGLGLRWRSSGDPVVLGSGHVWDYGKRVRACGFGD